LRHKAILFSVFTALLANCISAQLPAIQQQAIVLKRQVERNHYSPRAIDDSFSVRVFDLFIENIDDQLKLFTEDEFNSLAKYKYSIDDELNGKQWAFLDFASKLQKKALLRADSLVRSILAKPIDLNGDEKMKLVRKEQASFPKDIAGLKAKWTRWIKFLMLTRAYSMMQGDSSNRSLSEIIQKNEAVIREQIAKGQAKAFQSDLEGFDENIRKSFLNSIASSFDPHTNYFSPAQQERFQAELSTQEFSYGFDIDETKEGKIIVSALIPGGPAWKSGEIHKEDEVLQLQKNGKPILDLSTSSIEEADQFLRTADHDELSVKIRKTNGAVKTVVLKKEKIEVEENVVKGFMLLGTKKIGYISLPDFYTKWENETGSGCANDIAKQIIMMKKENMDGLIIDLRFNGGGSLFEAVQICGIFIDEGPMIGIKGRDGKLVFQKDPFRGTIYDGPLAIMINNQSASASEMVSATLQDYNRAIIIGSSSFGKATMQQVLPMDTNNIKKTISPDGFVKITMGKLYRLNGETTQWNGVIPDIELPDEYEGLDYHEKFLPNALLPDTARKNNYYKTMEPLSIQALSASSKKRVAENPSFQNIESIITRTKSERTNGLVIPLQPAAFEKWISERDRKEVNVNTVFSTTNKELEKDIYIQETYLLMNDLINLWKK